MKIDRPDSNSAPTAEEFSDVKRQLKFFREYDPLTKLYNKRTFVNNVTERIKNESDTEFDIVCIDIQRFKVFNFKYGMDEGDNFLQYLANELSKHFPEANGNISRLYGDVFGICLPAKMRQQAVEIISEIFWLYNENSILLPAIGFCSLAPGDSVMEASNCAITAMHSIKGQSSKYFAVYEKEQGNYLVEEQTLLEELERAFENDEFVVFIQPKCNMYTGKIMGGEALVRWLHPKRGLTPPGLFLPVLENHDLIAKLDSIVWEKTAAWLKSRMDRGDKVLPISINISRTDIMEINIVEHLNYLVEHYNIEPKFLQLEITESAYVADEDLIAKVTERLMRKGFTILMDDFGSGYSSLNMLTTVKMDIMKIDMRFLKYDDVKSRGVLEAVVQMGKHMDMPIIAEGVETKEHVDFLLSIGCSYAQGYYFYKPMSIDEFEKLLSNADKVDYEDMGIFQLSTNMLLDYKSLVQNDALTNDVLGNMIGPSAVYLLKNDKIMFVSATKKYYSLIDLTSHINESAWDILPDIYPDDRQTMLDAFKTAYDDNGKNGADVTIRRKIKDKFVKMLITIYYLRDTKEGSFFCGVLKSKII